MREIIDIKGLALTFTPPFGLFITVTPSNLMLQDVFIQSIDNIWDDKNILWPQSEIERCLDVYALRNNVYVLAYI